MKLVSLTHLKAWGDADKFCSGIAFLLIFPKEGKAEERTYGLAMVWVHPYQVRVSTIEEAIKQLDKLTPSGPNWPYALVWLNGDAWHVPLPTEGHLSVMMEGSTSSIPCWRICQLVIHQLLSSGSQVIYPEGLNGCHIPVIMFLPKLFSKGITMLEGKSTFLQVDLSQSATKEQEFKVLSFSNCSNTTLAANPTQAFPPKVDSQVSMTMDVSELLSQLALDTSGQAPGSSTPKRPVFLALASSLPLKLDDSTKLVDTSSQVSIPDEEEVDGPMLEDIHASPSHPDGAPEGSSDTPL